MAVLQHRQPDRIPHFEWIIDASVRDAICPGCTMEEFSVRMDLDAILTGPDFAKQTIAPGRTRNERGMISGNTGQGHSFPLGGPIGTLADLKNYTPPDPHAPGRYDSLERIVARYKDDRAIGVHLNDVFSIPRNLMGMENLLMAFATEPELIEGLVRLSVDINIEMANQVAKRGADFIFTGDDYAATEGPLISPAMFRQFLHEPLKEVMAGFKATGLPVIKHTDGNILPILDMILSADIDCLDPIDPVAGLDIGCFKKNYGDRIALKGNVDCAHTLTFGAEKDVVEETKSVIRKAAGGGGLILSSSNSIHSAVKPGNYLAMWNAIRMYGTYPIRLDGWDDSGAGEAFA
jgi:uroporphyrinogen decarboxylase